MKVVSDGTFVFAAGRVIVTGWTFDMEGAPFPTTDQMVFCAMQHVARKAGVVHMFGEADEAIPLDAQRIALNAIRKAQVPVEPEQSSSRWWQFWKRKGASPAAK